MKESRLIIDDDNCPYCGAEPGKRHVDDCTVELCPDCGGQYIICDHKGKRETRLPWTGEWPGVAECREFGWYAKMVLGKGWVPCDEKEPGATEDLNRLRTDAIWSEKDQRFILPSRNVE